MPVWLPVENSASCFKWLWGVEVQGTEVSKVRVRRGRMFSLNVTYQGHVVIRSSVYLFVIRGRDKVFFRGGAWALCID